MIVNELKTIKPSQKIRAFVIIRHEKNETFLHCSNKELYIEQDIFDGKRALTLSGKIKAMYYMQNMIISNIIEGFVTYEDAKTFRDTSLPDIGYYITPCIIQEDSIIIRGDKGRIGFQNLVIDVRDEKDDTELERRIVEDNIRKYFKADLPESSAEAAES